MKPEEIERLFREELEKLDHAPGVDWNDDQAWNKIHHGLKGGWHSGWTWIVSAITVVVTCLLIYQVVTSPHAPVVQKKKNPPQSAVRTPRTTPEPLLAEKTEPVERKSAAAKNNLQPPKEVTAVVTGSPDTLSQPLKIDTVSSKTIDRKFLNRLELRNRPLASSNFTLPMPKLSILHLKVENSFNFTNLSRSIHAEKEAGENFYYFYEYRKNWVPPLFGNNNSRYVMQNNYTLTNYHR